MKRLLALAALLALTAAPAFSQVQPVPKWHSDPLYWLSARFVNSFPAYASGTLHGMGVETDTIGVFSLNDAVLPPYSQSLAASQYLAGGNGTVAMPRDTIPVIAKLRFEVDTSTVTIGGAESSPLVTVDTLIVNIFQGTWMPALIGNQTQPVTPARWLGSKVFTAAVVVGADSSTSVVEVPLPAHYFSATTTANAAWTVRVGTPAPAFTITKPVTNIIMGNKFYATVQSIGGTFPACKVSIGYYRLE